MGLKDIHSRSKVVNEQPMSPNDLQVLTQLIIKAENCHIWLKSFVRDHKFSINSYHEARKLKKYVVLSKGFYPIVDGFESHSCKIKQGN